jgi:hypothetical protein
MSPEEFFASEKSVKRSMSPEEFFASEKRATRSFSDVPGEALSNIPSSAKRFAEGIVQPIIHPIDTATALGTAALSPMQTGRAIKEAVVDRYGSMEALKNTLATDPVGVFGDISTIFTGGGMGAGKAASMISKGGRLADALRKTGEVATKVGDYTNPLSAVIKPIAKVLNPSVDKNIQKLLDEGITPTTGQMLGKGASRFEEALTSVPIAGDFIKDAKLRAVDALNMAAINRSLKPIGTKLPKDVIGRDAIQFASDALGNAYNNLLPKIKIKSDSVFNTNIKNLKDMVNSGAINQSSKDYFNNIINNQLLGKLRGRKSMDGETLKGINSDLNKKIADLSASTLNDERVIAGALRELQDNIRKLAVRSNPNYANQLKQIDTGYANFKRVENASAKLGAEEGVFSPAQLQNAVRSLDKSKDKSKFAKGDALMQDLSESAKEVLGNKVPDSGTPYRSLTALLAGGGAAALYGHPLVAASLLASPIVYSKTGQQISAALLAKRPKMIKNIGTGIDNKTAKRIALLLTQANKMPRGSNEQEEALSQIEQLQGAK